MGHISSIRVKNVHPAPGVFIRCGAKFQSFQISCRPRNVYDRSRHLVTVITRTSHARSI